MSKRLKIKSREGVDVEVVVTLEENPVLYHLILIVEKLDEILTAVKPK